LAFFNVVILTYDKIQNYKILKIKNILVLFHCHKKADIFWTKQNFITNFAKFHSCAMGTESASWYLLLVVAASGVLAQQQQPSPMGLFEATVGVVSEGTRFMNSNPRDAEPLRKSYDFVVVGAGTAGCVLANRLSANPAHTVLLIEAGRDESFIMDIPILANFFQLTQTNWGHKTMKQDTACLGLRNKQCKLPRGKVLGGSSAINYMIYTRGNKLDYDRWRDMGNPGWGYDDILPYFKRLEDVQILRYILAGFYQSSEKHNTAFC
jgi:GMC oxidoreductase